MCQHVKLFHFLIFVYFTFRSNCGNSSMSLDATRWTYWRTGWCFDTEGGSGAVAALPAEVSAMLAAAAPATRQPKRRAAASVVNTSQTAFLGRTCKETKRVQWQKQNKTTNRLTKKKVFLFTINWLKSCSLSKFCWLYKRIRTCQDWNLSSWALLGITELTEI